MLIPLNEPSNFRYIHINPATNRVHLLVPFIAGIDISTDNTCKSGVELSAFFEGGAFNELESYKSTLEFHLSLLEENIPYYRTKKERLDQINLYLEHEARLHRDIVTPQDEPIITIDIAPEALMDKLSDVQWEKLPKEVVDACRALPAFKVHQLLDDAAKGKQE